MNPSHQSLKNSNITNKFKNSKLEKTTSTAKTNKINTNKNTNKLTNNDDKINLNSNTNTNSFQNTINKIQYKNNQSISKNNQNQDCLTSFISHRTLVSSALSPNNKENKLRETIKNIITTTMADSRKKNFKNTDSIKALKSPKEETKIKFIETKKPIIPYEEQIKTYIKKNVDKNYLCGICFNLFNEPILCYKCEMIFCRICLKKQIEEKGKCINCFNIIFYDQCKFSENDHYENIYENTMLNCIYYPVCKKTSNLNEIQEHINTCVFKENKEKYDKIVLEKTGVHPDYNKYKSIYDNDILDSNPLFNFSKLNYPDRSQDPYSKLHIFDYYLKTQRPFRSFTFDEISRSVGKGDLKKKEYPIKYTEPKFNQEILNDFKSKLGNFNNLISSLNNKISDCIIDLANITKVSNDKMKMMINS
jgi:hypothetical protein